MRLLFYTGPHFTRSTCDSSALISVWPDNNITLNRCKSDDVNVLFVIAGRHVAPIITVGMTKLKSSNYTETNVGDPGSEDYQDGALLIRLTLNTPRVLAQQNGSQPVEISCEVNYTSTIPDCTARVTTYLTVTDCPTSAPPTSTCNHMPSNTDGATTQGLNPILNVNSDLTSSGMPPMNRTTANQFIITLIMIMICSLALA